MTSPSSQHSPEAPPHPWHTLDIAATARALQTDPTQGLSTADARQRLERHGPNALQHARRRPLWRLLSEQFADVMILVLIAAAAISGLLGELADTLAILIIVLLNAVVGAVQQFRAEHAIAALRQMAAPGARVLREGRLQTVTAAELVPGDIVLLEAGNIVPADLRLFDAAGLKVDESALTGESMSVVKQAAALADPDLPLGERTNLTFKGTLVSHGRATGIVVATAMNTELGRIATLLQQDRITHTPLQQRLARFGKHLALAVLGICALIFIAGWLRGEPLMLMFLTAVSLAVAAIPEALPAVVTVSLALGAGTMSRRNALIRRLPAVETLGSVTYICSDKTGTLTQNKMTLESLYTTGRWQAYPPATASTDHDTIPSVATEPSQLWTLLGWALALSNDAVAQNRGSDSREQVNGDPTEVALYLAAGRAGFAKPALQQVLPRQAELPFDSERKCMTTIHDITTEQGLLAFTKGAPEAVLHHCDQLLTDSGIGPLDRQQLLDEAETMAAQGYRILALAYRRWPQLPDTLTAEILERDLTLLGLVALIDPPRPEANEAVRLCRSAGITPVMITGDHPATAKAIAERLGIATAGDKVISGRQLARISDAQLRAKVEHLRVYARVTPEQKIRIVTALQQHGEFTAMTGDGVNDAPALKRADIGIAMGRMGTDVARESADMVLLDDNFATVVAAVREGRRIYDNIRKFVKYTMTSNAGEIWTLFLAPFIGLPIPLLPIHILWINLVTDGLPGLALATEPQENGIMRRPPRPPGESIFAHGMWQHIIWVGLLIGGLSILAQAWAFKGGSEHWQTLVFTVLTFSQLAHVMVIRSETGSLVTLGLLSNRPLLGAVLLTIVLQLAVIYVPLLNPVFKTTPLPFTELALCFAVPMVVVAAVEWEKWMMRRGWLYGQRAEQ